MKWDKDIDSQVLTDRIVGKLECLILSGRYPPGAKLREKTLSDELGISRGPLREAIRTLEGRRLLERIPHSGVHVVSLSPDDLEQILIAREPLEGMVARLAAENMTVAEVQALKDAVNLMGNQPDDVVEAMFSEGPDNDFHRLVAKGCRNRWLENLLVKDVYSLLRLYRIQAAKRPDLSDTIEEHKLIIDRIHARDADGAEVAMREHVKRSRIRTLERVKSAGTQISSDVRDPSLSVGY